MRVDDPAALISSLFLDREPYKTLCASEVARALAGASGDWRSYMAGVHQAVDALVRSGTVALSWEGRKLPRREGPYRIGLPTPP